MAEIYGKINIFGELEIDPVSIVRGQQIILNPTRDEMVNNGFKRVYYEERPDTSEYDDAGIEYYVKMHFDETDDSIYVRYEIVERDVEETDDSVPF